MRFFLGTHQADWLDKVDVSLFVSTRRLKKRKTLPRARAAWGLDSGGFTELSTYGQWTVKPKDYVREVRWYAEDIGDLAFAAPQDWMCEPWIIEKTGLSIEEHQRLTVENYLELKTLGDELPFIPVLQGWRKDDYHRHADAYGKAGVDLAAEPLVGLGSVCRRQEMTEAEDIVLSLRPLKLHGFGFKTTGLKRYGYLLESADSMAWSYAGRRRGTCLEYKSRCANHLHWALAWREQALTGLEYQQLHLGIQGG